MSYSKDRSNVKNSNIRLETADSCSFESTSPSRNEGEKLPEAKKLILTWRYWKVLQNEGRNGEH